MNRTMTALQFWLVSGTVALGLVFVLVNITLFLSNRSEQAEVNARQQYVNDSIKINRIGNQLIQSIANLSIQTKDEKLKALLADHGIQFSESSSAAVVKESK